MVEPKIEANEKLTLFCSIDGLAVEHKVRYGQYDMKIKHFHPEYEIFYILDGNRDFFFDNRIYHASKGDLILIDSNLIHMTKSTGVDDLGHNRIILYITPDRMKSIESRFPSLNLTRFFRSNYGVYHLDEEQQNHFMDFYYRFKKEYQDKSSNYQMAMELCVIELLLYMTRDLKRYPDASSDTKDNKNLRHAYEIADYLSEHYRDDIDLDFLAKKFFLSKYYLCRTFHEVTGYNIREYINIYRIRAAKQLLEESDESIDSVASKVGYHSSTHFEKIFKSYMNISPLKYRKQRNVYVSMIPVVDHLS
ncbi:AraC family transcriptional regulator [Oribacterium sp. C9]|uniref:AraC family transcriptional regulator n=1 Tax=Oribacterium sp. C9 TaxID=1943579 RepID=UPI00098E8839|nr:AraC family transcriptional regulator [Oribacterium sp. C9]OON85389.1 AraC family transcriptional regulator [Oribacterium sp. C9]